MVRTRRSLGRSPSFLIFFVVALVLAVVIRGQYVDYYKGLELPSGSLTLKTKLPEKPTPATPAVAEKPPVTLPLKVPFTTQAPFALWDPLHEEACEEASLLMVYYYRTGQKFNSPLEADTEIKKLVAWEESNGYKVDLTVKELVAVAGKYMKLKTGRVIVGPTVDQLKAELMAGRPVIVPAAGRELHNPNFTAPGPIYHMLVLKSYDETGFIVNDPGTRRGENYHYGFKTIMDAMHDWDPDNILNGQKAVVVFD
ncbi:MAG: C39 family peptidase [Candidatus Berkelbacteria bacterium]|nr:C39 family peptidase [Candidatus Berkelbacteria bacterium]MCR4307806.1 C39 family peptidase [Candidatus Berkelbacteria bacterium]